MKGFLPVIIGMLIISLFTFSLVSFGIDFTEQNEANVSLRDNPIINKSFGNIGSNLAGAKTTAQGQKGVLDQSPPDSDSLSIPSTSIFSSRTVFTDMAFGTYNLVFQLITDVFFSNQFSAFVSTISSILLVILIVYGIKFLRTGDPD